MPLAALSVDAGGAAARDRPGTPNNVAARECNGEFRDVPRKLAGLPAICLSFYNTAGEQVTFDIEMTIDNNKVFDFAWVRKRAGCGPLPPHLGPANCTAYRNLAGYGASVRGKGDQVLFLKDLDFGSQYCMRFKARRTSDQVVSAVWSAWACARTSAQPPKPALPAVTASILPEEWTSDLRTKLPPRVQVSWSWSRPHQTAFVKIAAEATDKRYDPALRQVVDPATEYPQDPNANAGRGLLFEIPAGMRADGRLPELKFTVCAYNVTGATCARPVVARAPGAPLVREKLPGSGGAVVRTPSSSGAVTKPPGAAAGTAVAPALKPPPGAVRRLPVQ